jgi:membrane protein insertase Oxa1/YidC/SpoIIIJ
MIGVFSINVPAGLPLYWLTSSLWRIGQQQLVLNKFYDDPEYKAVLAEQAKERTKKAGDTDKGSPRSARGRPPARRPEPKPKPTSGRVTQPGARSQKKRKR